MRYKLLLLFLLSLSTSGISQFYPVPEIELDLRHVDTNAKTMTVKSFQISGLVTVKEFKTYLSAVKRDSSSAFYRAQLPQSITINQKMVNEILASSELQDKPMPGVSWSVARNYCTWLTGLSKQKGNNEQYGLPLLSQILACNEVYGQKRMSELECWTLNSYDESSFNFFGLDYVYEADKDYPPSMKRKVVYNGSYHMNYVPGNAFRKLHYEYQDSSSRYIGFRIVRNEKQSDYQTIQMGETTVHFNLRNNHLDGVYGERYANGKLKVLGSFNNGQRIGVWSVWDENGVLKVQRNYEPNKVFKFIYPISNNAYSHIYDQYPIYTFKRNKQGFSPYVYVEERAIYYSKRNWRQVSQENEIDLFQQVDFKSIVAAIFETDAKWYLYGHSGDFKNEISADSIKSLRKSFVSWDFSRFEFKEDFFFDLDRLVSDSRQIAISFYKNSTDQSPTYTIFFPQIRSVLTKFKMEVPHLSDIENLDDYFFFHAYRGNIINVSYFNDKMIKTDLEMEIGMLVDEHNIWMLFNR